ncbi:hypothetical protein [Roseivivax marinus]|uniref:hypothetical protein n=1 Tax=Roseivivax marinus TaxID=1379903 RepID=UPI00273D7612|nr:hypothetical protein [Roseivivax marinus]
MRLPGLIYDPADGRVLYSIMTTAERAVMRAARGEPIWMGEVEDPPAHYVTGEPLQLLPRPSIVAPVAGPAPWTWDLSTLPAGTTVAIRNEIGDTLEITDLAEPLELVDAGTYQVRLSPPFPWLALDATIAVPDA